MNAKEQVLKQLRHLENTRRHLIRMPVPDERLIERVESKIEQLNYKLDALEYSEYIYNEFN